MHLTDEQLLGWTADGHDLMDEANHDELSNLKEHIDHCSDCHQRLAHLQSFRYKLVQDTKSAMPTTQWSSLERTFVAQNTHKQHRFFESKIKRLQIGLVSLAATFLIFLLAPSDADNMATILGQQLDELIKDNSQLQQTINQRSGSVNDQVVVTRTMLMVATKNLQFKLKQIDSEIQLSYLREYPIEEKIKLWKSRRELLLQSVCNHIEQPTSTI